jgi:hypothetical protein
MDGLTNVGGGIIGVIIFFWQIFLAWWWLIPPFLVYPFWRRIYLNYIQDVWLKEKGKYKLLEIKLSEEIIRPVKAMEQVFNNLWFVLDDPNAREQWLDGKQMLHFSLEIVGRGGQIHFLLRIPSAHAETAKSIIYAQYPELEISDFVEYTSEVPEFLPNKEWNLWGTDMKLIKPDSYPIKTYPMFFEESSSDKEQFKIEALSSLLEGLSTLKPEEQIWIQIVAVPTREDLTGWITRAREARDKILQREGGKDLIRKPIFRQVIDILFFQQEFQEIEVKEKTKPSLQDIPEAEKKMAEAIDRKASKPSFDCFIRVIYLAKREVFFKPRVTIPINFFLGFNTENLNSFKPKSTSIKYPPFEDQRLYVKQRDIFWHYLNRLVPGYPEAKNTYILNAEELASLFHFPSRVMAPASGLARIRAKKGEPPANLPVE